MSTSPCSPIEARCADIRNSSRASSITQALRMVSRDVERNATRISTLSAANGDVIIRSVRNAAELDEVYRITYDAYLERGYCTARPDGRLIHYPHLDNIPETTVLVAVVGGHIVGTNSLTLDGPRGLQVDGDFKAACDCIRAEGRKLAGAWRMATRGTCRNERRVVMALIEETTRHAIRAGVQTCAFTFNPRHERIYQRLLNLETVARNDAMAGLRNAPAVFMRWDVERCPKRFLAPRSGAQVGAAAS